MAQVNASTQRTIDADPQKVLAAVSDYREARPRLLTDAYRDYRVEEGGQGAGTVAHWVLQATKSRSRDQTVDVEARAEGGIVERDRNSSMVIEWAVVPRGEAQTSVTINTSWDGASGVGGFFERIFAPLGLQRIHGGVLDNLASYVASPGTAPN